MSQSQSSSGSPWTEVLPNPMAPDFAAMCAKGAENLAAMQKEWLETLEHARRGWLPGWTPRQSSAPISLPRWQPPKQFPMQRRRIRNG